MNHQVIHPALLLALAFLAPGPCAAEGGPYGIKSGMVETTSGAFGPTVTEEYFDDHGARSARYTTTTTMGQTSHRLQLHLPDGADYDIDLDEKSGTLTHLPPEAGNSAAMAQLLKDARVTPLPARRVLGRRCAGRQYEGAEGTVRIWSWKGIALRTEMGTIVVRATRLRQGAVPPEKFVVPAGITIRNAP